MGEDLEKKDKDRRKALSPTGKMEYTGKAPSVPSLINPVKTPASL